MIMIMIMAGLSGLWPAETPRLTTSTPTLPTTLLSRESQLSWVNDSYFYWTITNYEGEKLAEEWLKDNGHVAIINVWRPTVRAVEKSPLGFLDINSVDCKVTKVP